MGTCSTLGNLSSAWPVWIYEGALLFVTGISCNYKDSPYKGDWRGAMTKGPRLSRPPSKSCLICVVKPAAGAAGRALSNLAPKIALNRRTPYRKSQEIPVSSRRLASPIKLGLRCVWTYLALKVFGTIRDSQSKYMPRSQIGPRIAALSRAPRRTVRGLLARDAELPLPGPETFRRVNRGLVTFCTSE
jgi:hypothetical protein